MSLTWYTEGWSRISGGGGASGSVNSEEEEQGLRSETWNEGWMRYLGAERVRWLPGCPEPGTLCTEPRRV